MAAFTFEEQRVIIQFLHLRGMKPAEIHQQLSETCSDGVMDVKHVRSWVRQFTEGRTSCENTPKEPPPRGAHLAETFRNFRSSCTMVSTDPTDMPALAAICLTVKRRSSITICSTRAIMSSDRLVRGGGSFGLFFTRRSAFCELSYPRTHIFHVHNAIIACLTQLLMNFDGFHATRVEESVNP